MVIVDWVDSTQPVSEWAWLDDASSWREVTRCQSVGWLISDGPDVKVLAPNMGTICGEVQVSGVVRIPTRCITRMVRLRLGDATASASLCGDSGGVARSPQGQRVVDGSGRAHQ